MVEMVYDRLKPNSIEQYRKEVRSAIAKRASTDGRLPHLLEIMKRDEISKPEHVINQSRIVTNLLHKVFSSKKCESMGEICNLDSIL